MSAIRSARRHLARVACALTAAAASPALAQQPARLFDVVVSLHDQRAGDGRGDTRETPFSAQDAVEEVIEAFADGVYESTEGAHALRRVVIHEDGAFASTADIVWGDLGVPRAAVSGIVDRSRHVHAFDRFPRPGGQHLDFLATARGRQQLGYALAHEWAHYAYGLFDEYRVPGRFGAFEPGEPVDGDDPVVPSLMNDPFAAVDGRSEWLNFSIAPNALAGSDFENTRDTAQHRVHSASGWETLARPPRDDAQDLRLLARSRAHYPELAGVAPAGASIPRTNDLPGASRTRLDIVWAGDAVTYEIVFDASANACVDSKLESAKVAAKHVVDSAVAGETLIGVVAYSSGARVVLPPTAITGEAARQTVREAIDDISCGGLTFLEAGARTALAELAGSREGLVVLMSTAPATDDPLDVVPDFQQAGVPIVAIAHGDDADVDTLRRLAEQTGGHLVVSGAPLASIVRTVQDARIAASPAVGLVSVDATLTAGGPVSVPVLVDDSLGQLDVTAVHDEGPTAANVALRSPSGALVEPLDAEVTTGQTARNFTVRAPEAGTWRLEAVSTRTVQLRAQANALPAAPTFDVVVEAVGGSPDGGTSQGVAVVQHPAPLLIVAGVQEALPVRGAVVTALLTEPDGRRSPVALRDDGEPPDVLEGDGTYTAVVLPGQSGLHELEVRVDNGASTAFRTRRGLPGLLDPDGSVPPAELDDLIDEGFARFSRLQVTVDGFGFDDHSDTAAGASSLGADGVKRTGRIDRAGDADVFEIVVPANAQRVSCRVTDQALGMEGRVRVLGPDGLFVISDVSRSALPEDEYVLTSVATGALDRFFVEVRHAETGGTGTYCVSCGATVVGEPSESELFPACLPGDVSPLGAGDGVVSLADFVAGRRRLLEQEPSQARDGTCADLHPGVVTCAPASGPSSWCVAGDGRFGLGDLVILRRLVAGVHVVDCTTCAPRLASGDGPVLPGDVAPRGAPDGRVNVGDVVRLLRFAVGKELPNEDELPLADVAPLAPIDGGLFEVSADGRVNVGDVVITLRLAVGLDVVRWPEHELVVRAGAPVTHAAYSATLTGWPRWAEVTGVDVAGCEGDVDTAGDMLAVTCVSDPAPIASDGELFTVRYRAPHALSPELLGVRSQFLSPDLEPLAIPVHVEENR